MIITNMKYRELMPKYHNHPQPIEKIIGFKHGECSFNYRWHHFYVKSIDQLNAGKQIMIDKIT